MKPFLRILLAAFAAASLCGCLVTDKPLPAGEAPSAQSPLLGLWQSPWPAMLTKESLTVTYQPGADYYVAVRERGRYMGSDTAGRMIETQETIDYKAYPSTVAGRTFFSLLTSKSDTIVYTIVEAVFEDGGKRLVLREPSDEAVERAMADGRLSWRIQEDSKVATSEPAATAAWLATLTDADFKVHQTFERWPAPIDELKKGLS